MARKLTREALAFIPDAVEWLSDNVWADVDPDVFAYLRPDEIVDGVQRHYEGGWAAFVATVEAGR